MFSLRLWRTVVCTCVCGTPDERGIGRQAEREVLRKAGASSKLRVLPGTRLAWGSLPLESGGRTQLPAPRWPRPTCWARHPEPLSPPLSQGAPRRAHVTCFLRGSDEPMRVKQPCSVLEHGRAGSGQRVAEKSGNS